MSGTAPVAGLAALFERLAAEPGSGVSVGYVGTATEYRRGEVVFAVGGPDVVEVRLRPEIAAAAARTPDAAASPRGQGWIRFSPRRLDRFALDRAESWFRSAHRTATA